MDGSRCRDNEGASSRREFGQCALDERISVLHRTWRRGGRGPKSKPRFVFFRSSSAGEAIDAKPLRRATLLGSSILRIDSDPFAAPFYESQGATLVGTAKSTSTGRGLPLFELRM